ADRNRSHWSTSKTPSYTKSVSWQHHLLHQRFLNDTFAIIGVVSENGIYGHSRFCNTDFDDKLACLNLSGV
ncbi:hypothetical protein SJ325_31020, partial [Klebsiella pasteurii]|nr:hypothetical protein [Klebsiella pasteurii]